MLIGQVRRALFVPWTSRWNAMIRDITALVERGLHFRDAHAA